MSGGSEIWEHFTKCPDDKDHAICNYCQSKLSRKGGCTTAMRSHVKSQHKGIQLMGKKMFSSKSPSPRPVQVQPSIKSSMASAAQPKLKPMSKSEQEDLKRAAAWMCAVDCRPLSMVNGRGLRNFCRKLNPMFTMPDRHLVASYVKKIYLEGHAELKSDIKGCAVGLTTDLWTSHANEGYLTLTAQYINPQWIQRTRVLGTRVLQSRHTGDKVAEMINNMVTEYELGKVMGICTDNASNMKVACSTGGLQRIPCFSHTLQLAIADGMKLGKKTNSPNGTIQKAISRAKKLVTFFNHSTPGKHIILIFTHCDSNSNFKFSINPFHLTISKSHFSNYHSSQDGISSNTDRQR